MVTSLWSVMQEIIRFQIEHLLDRLKPEIRKRAVFIYRERKEGSDGRNVLADTSYLTEPPVIAFYLSTIGEMNPDEETLKQIISHELIHTFSKNEIEAYSRQVTMDFFKKEI